MSESTLSMRLLIAELEASVESMKDLVGKLDKIRAWQQCNPTRFVPPADLSVSCSEIAETDRLCLETLKRADGVAPGLSHHWIETNIHRIKLTATEGLLAHFVEKHIELRRALAIVKKLGSPASPPTTILFLSSDPTDKSPMRLGQEVRDIEDVLRLAPLPQAFLLTSRFCVRAPDVSRALLESDAEIVHFSGHGTDRGELCFENESGRVLPVDAGALATLFELVRERVRCVILNACYSEPQARAIARCIPYVIGMSREISDKAALAFAVGFYQAIGAGKDYRDAFGFGCAQIRLQGVPEHLTPVLLTHGGEHRSGSA